MILCDTNIIIELYKNNALIVGQLRQHGSENISISAITQAELFFGALNRTELQTIKRHLSNLTQIPINKEISATFIQLMEQYSLSHKLSIPDALIAATSIQSSYPLFTLNLKDFRFIEGLQLFQPK